MEPISKKEPGKAWLRPIIICSSNCPLFTAAPQTWKQGTANEKHAQI